VGKRGYVQGGKSLKAIRSRENFSMLELCVMLGVITALFGMALPVWSHIRKNALNAKALGNREYAEEAVVSYWHDAGCEGSGYQGLTAENMNQRDITCYWVDAQTLFSDDVDLDDLSRDHFASVLIVRETSMPTEEIGVATVSQTGTVYYTYFSKGEVTESGQIDFSDFKTKESQSLQADARGKLNPE
jgi:type II secretory pathway pseudopilin PulG